MSTSYEQSTLLKKIKTRKQRQLPLRIAFLDIDSTMTGNAQATNHTRKKLEELGYGIVYVTARTEEMIMSSKAFKLSQARGFDRPEPHLGRYENKRIYIPPEQIEPEGLLDPDIIAGSTGTQIFIHQTNHSYLPDIKYQAKFQQTSVLWRKRCLELIDEFNLHSKRAYTENYENPSSYLNGTSDVFTPKFRIVLSFQSNQDRKLFRSFISKNRKEKNLNIRVSQDLDIKHERITACITPKNASKAKAVDHIIDQICAESDIQRSSLHVLLAGDSFPDIEMGIRAAKGTQATFLLSGGSLLAHELTCLKHHQTENIIGEIKRNLHACLLKGYYEYKSLQNRHFIVCDEACQGKVAVESILYLLPTQEK